MPKPIDAIDIGLVDPAELIERARERGIFVFDLETTGLSPRKDRIEGIAFYVPPEDQVTLLGDLVREPKPALRAWYPFTNDTFRTWVQPDESLDEQSARLNYERLCAKPPDSDTLLDAKAAWVKLRQRPKVMNLRPRMPQSETMEKLRPLFEQSPGTVCLAHNLKFDYGFMRHASGCEFGYWERSGVDRLAAIGRGDIDPGPKECGGLLFADSMLADFLCDENYYQYGLKRRTKELFGHDMTTYKDVMRYRMQGTLSFMADEDGADSLGHYAMDDCYWTWRLFEDRMRELDSQTPGEKLSLTANAVDQLADVTRKEVPISPFDRTRRMGNLERIFWGIDMRVCLLLEEMESAGILIDWEWLQKVTARLETEKDVIIGRIEKRIGWTLNPNSQAQVAALLFSPEDRGGLGLPSKGIKRGKTGAISTGSKEISHLKRADPLVADVLDWRSKDTIQANFSVKLAKIAQAEPDCRIYSHFNQTGTKIFRLSCVSGGTVLGLNVDGTSISSRIDRLREFSGQDVRIVTHKGRERRITHLINKGPGFMFDVETDDGQTIRCTAEHRFYTERGWRALKDIEPWTRLLRAEVCEAQARGRWTPMGVGSPIVPTDLRGGRAGRALEDSRLRTLERDRSAVQGDLRVGVYSLVQGNADEATRPGRDPARVPDLRSIPADEGVSAHQGVVQDRVRGQRSDAGGSQEEVRHLTPSHDSSGDVLPRVRVGFAGEAWEIDQRQQAQVRYLLSEDGVVRVAACWKEHDRDRQAIRRRRVSSVTGHPAARHRPVERSQHIVACASIRRGTDGPSSSQSRRRGDDSVRITGLCGSRGDLPAIDVVGAADQGRGECSPHEGVARRPRTRAPHVRGEPCRDAVVACADGSRDLAPATVLLLQELAGGLRVAGQEADGRGRWCISPELRGDQGSGRQEDEEGAGAWLQGAAVYDERGGQEAAHGDPQDRGGSWACVASITPAGIEPVWDITVEEDESYVAQGFVNHNSSNPVNLQNQPRDDELIRKAFCARLPDPSEAQFKKQSAFERRLYEQLLTGEEIGALLDDPTLQLYSADYCVVEGTRVATERGAVRIEDIVAHGDRAVLEDGSSADISELIDRGELPVVELRTKLGYTLRATALHRIRVVDADGNYEWRRIGELRHTDYVAVQAGCQRGRALPRLPSIEFTHHHNRRETTVPEELTEDVAEFLGYLVGDGCVQPYYVGFVVAQKDEDVWEWAQSRATSAFSISPTRAVYRGVFAAKFHSRPLVRWCEAVGVGKEHVPEALWGAPPRVVCAFLRGLFEADGSIGKKSNGQRITVAGVGRELMRQVHQMLLSVGVPAILRSNRQKLSNKLLWVVSIPSAYAARFAAQIGFIGKRKSEQLERYVASANVSATVGGFPNLQLKARKLRLSGEARRLLNNTGSLGRPVSLALAEQVRAEDDGAYQALGLFRTVEYGTVFDKVKEVVPAGTAHVYDLSVPGPTTYISDGFISHNSQIELRVAAHLSGDKGMIEVYRTGHPCTRADGGGSCERYQWWECGSKIEREDGTEAKCKHTWVPEQWKPKEPGAPTRCPKCNGEKIEHQKRCRHVDLHTRTAEDANVPRNPLAKNLNFGVLYRIGAPRFCQYADLFDEKGDPRVEYAEQVIKAWFAAYPAIHPFHVLTEQKLKRDGWYACTLTGRRRRLDRERWKNEYRAITQGIQFQVSGSAQDILKRAMIDIAIDRERRIANARPAEQRLWKKTKLILQVHDEVTYVGPTCLENEIIPMINDGMAGAANLKVPIPADCKSGRTWQGVH